MTDSEHASSIEAHGSQEFRRPVALLGAVIASLGVSGLLDDSGLIDHPWWAVVVLAAVVCCLAAIATTVRALLHR